MTTRETILRAWWSARRKADAEGVVSLDSSAFAGYALERSDGDIAAAHDLIPIAPEAFFARARDALDNVSAEERKPAVAASVAP
jgi:hypothetical protein